MTQLFEKMIQCFTKLPQHLYGPRIPKIFQLAMQVMKCLKDEHDAKRLRIVHVNNRFKRPTSDNWQDIAVSWHVVNNAKMLEYCCVT